MTDRPFKERNPLYEGEHHGIRWAIYQARITSVLCGYAQIPDGVTIHADMFHVHGGINYGRNWDTGGCSGWIGFDTAHTGDHWDTTYLREKIGIFVTHEGQRWQEQELAVRTGMDCERTWTVEALQGECEQLCEQIARCAERAPEEAP